MTTPWTADELTDNEKVLVTFGEHEEQTYRQLYDVAANAEYVALMADGHLGFVMPIGGVAAYRDTLSPVAVGFDIGCGNCAIKTSINLDEGREQGRYTARNWNAVADEIASTFSFGVGRSNNTRDAPVNHGLFDGSDWDSLPANVRDVLRHKAISQLGTIGGGNHYVDVFRDEEGFVWVGVHFGSRGLGHQIASGFLALGQGLEWGVRAPEVEVLLGTDTELGQRYWAAMHLAGAYAALGREYVARKVVDILRADPIEVVHNHHNFTWREEHYGEELYVVRKGATPAWPGQQSFVGGSMGDNAYIIAGFDYETRALLDHEALEYRDLQRRSLYSTVHGAGRVMSRSRAKGGRAKVNKATGEVRQPKRKGEVTRQMMSEWTKQAGVVVRGGDVDESPHVYRRLDKVLDQQGAARGPMQEGTIEVRHTLKPLVVVMADARVPRDD